MPTKKKEASASAPSKEIAVIVKRSAPVVLEAKSLSIATPEELTSSVSLLSRLNKSLDSVIAWKEKKTVPLNALLKAIRAETKPAETALEEAISIVRRKQTDYQTEKVAAEQAAKDAIAARVAPGRGNLSLETAVARMEEVEHVEKKVEAEEGSVIFKPHPCFEVIDITLVPIEYHLADEVRIRKAMSAGTELPGVRYWVEQRPSNSR